MPLHLIYARSRNNVIGKNGDLPWHLPEDLAHFKRTTLGQAVVMGRITWESIPDKFRPLPGRRNVVVSRQTDYPATGASVVNSLQDALALFPADEVVWLIGGAQLYAQALPLATKWWSLRLTPTLKVMRLRPSWALNGMRPNAVNTCQRKVWLTVW